MHAVRTVSLRTVAPPRRGEHVLGEGALGTERGHRPGADVARRLFRYRGETVDRMPTARLSSWGGRTRTSNFPVNSRAVCQLTYTPMLPSLPPQSAAFAKRIRSTPLLDTVVRRAAVNRSEGPGKLAPPEPLGGRRRRAARPRPRPDAHRRRSRSRPPAWRAHRLPPH